MSSNTRRLAAMLAGMVVLSSLAVTAGTPAGAAGGPIGTTAVEFQPTDYPLCATGGSNRTIRYMVDRIVANSPAAYYADGDHTDEDAPLYQPAGAAERADLRAGLHALIQDNPATANQRLADAGYAVCSGAIDSTFWRDLVLVYPVAGLGATTTEGAPMLLLYPGDNGAKSVLSGPHLRFETLVKEQILTALSNPSHFTKGAVLSGTHRCNRLAEAPEEYQGTTSVCGGSYRTSDMAHNVETAFQDMHDVLRDEYPETFLVQVHGMSEHGISVSRGANPGAGSADHPEDPITRAHAHARVELQDLLAAGGLTTEENLHYQNLTTCTPYTHSANGVAAPVRQLHCGTRNAQLDREVDNGSADRFIHIEQSMYIRQHHAAYVRWAMYGLSND